jgi:alanyl-tRNA synthetase
MQINNEVWEKLGPYTCQLNIDEVDNIDKTWEDISNKIGLDVDTVKKAISPIKDLYIILDHTRTAMMIINDGSLPSNVGGGSNVRNILRRVFALLKKNDWFEKESKAKGGNIPEANRLTMKDFIELFDYHKKDLGELYGAFPEYKSFSSIIEMEYDRWISTDAQQKTQLEKKLKKNPKLNIDDWIIAMTSWGIPADAIAQISGQPVPGNLYYEIAQRQERITKANEVILYNTTHLPETENLSYDLCHLNGFGGKIVDIFANINDNNKRNMVILDKSAFYPTSGGQQNDLGELKIDGSLYKVINCEKVGKCVLHILDKELPNPDNLHYVGQEVAGRIDEERRNVLRNHHTGTHIVFAACRRVLGPHVWQNGAKKTTEQVKKNQKNFLFQFFF